MSSANSNPNETFKVLDVGCGRSLNLVDVPVGAHIVGIDLDEAALAINEGLDEAIVGDVEKFELPMDEYDLIVCQDVLEHLRNPGAALERLVTAVKPGGRIEVRVPWVFSAKALIAKFTPHWFHVWVYRTILGSKQAGKPGFGPYPTYLRWNSLTPYKLRKYAESHGLQIEQCVIEEAVSIRRLCDEKPLLAVMLRIPFPLNDPRFTELRFTAIKPFLKAA